VTAETAKPTDASLIDRRLERVVFLTSAADAPAPVDGTVLVVLDTAWTPAPGDRPDLRPLRPATSRILERRDLFDEALARLDAWADATGMADRMTIDGVSWWFRVRETMWHWLHERMLWRLSIGELLDGATPSALVVPTTETALGDVADLLVGAVLPGTVAERTAEPAAHKPADGFPEPAADRPTGRLQWWESWPRRRRRRVELERRDRLLDERVRKLATERRGGVLILSHMGIRQQIRTVAGERPVDPNLGGVIERLRRDGDDPIVIGLGLDHRIDDEWPVIRDDDGLIPQSVVQKRWSTTNVADDQAGDSMIGSIETAPKAALDVDGIDLAPGLLPELKAFARTGLPIAQRQQPRVERLLDELRPGAMLLTHEGIRTPWLVAARRASVPTFAVQHGVLYPTHPGYAHPRHPGLVLASRTFVFGEYERRVLLEHGGYRDDEVVTTGSPRLDLDAALGEDPQDLLIERAALRRELGVRDGDMMLVVSTVNLPFIRRFHVVQMLERMLGGPLPGIHVVFKKHPGEVDDGPYQALLDGLARAGGYAPPPVTIVREVDLYRLLRAADAHLGLRSTVLTDAVVVGVPNLIATVQAHADMLGYVDAGVARPVRNRTELLEALANPRPADPAARAAFLERHFLPGDASERIARAVRDGRRNEADVGG
jgi:hypothetical protein